MLDAAVLLEAGWDDIVHEVWTTVIPLDEVLFILCINIFLPSVLWHRWFWHESILSVKSEWWDAGVVFCPKRGAVDVSVWPNWFHSKCQSAQVVLESKFQISSSEFIDWCRSVIWSAFITICGMALRLRVALNQLYTWAKLVLGWVIRLCRAFHLGILTSRTGQLSPISSVRWETSTDQRVMMFYN